MRTAVGPSLAQAQYTAHKIQAAHSHRVSPSGLVACRCIAQLFEAPGSEIDPSWAKEDKVSDEESTNDGVCPHPHAYSRGIELESAIASELFVQVCWASSSLETHAQM